MVAQTARKLDPVAAAAQLKQSRNIARKQKTRKRGRVLEFPGGRSLGTTSGSTSVGGELIDFPSVRPGGASNIREEELYNISRSPREERQVVKQKQLQEQANKVQWLKDRMSRPAMLKNYIQPPEEFESLSPQQRQLPEMQEAYQEFENESIQALMPQRGQKQGQAAQAMQAKMEKIQKLQNAQKKLAQHSEKIKELAGKAKRAIGQVWTGGSVATEAEDEFALLGTVNIPGKLVSMIRVAKLVLKPKGIISKDVKDGQFFKGVISWVEPTAPSFRDGSVITVGGHSLWGYFWLFIILFVIFIAIIILLAMLLGIVAAADAIATAVS